MRFKFLNYLLETVFSYPNVASLAPGKLNIPLNVGWVPINAMVPKLLRSVSTLQNSPYSTSPINSVSSRMVGTCARVVASTRAGLR